MNLDRCTIYIACLLESWSTPVVDGWKRLLPVTSKSHHVAPELLDSLR